MQHTLHHTPPPDTLDRATLDPALLAHLLRPARRIVALTGAGLSTESGIPDYRTPRPTPPSRPIRYLEFIHREDLRRRYWARSMAGWPAITTARPNPGHHALARLEAAGRLTTTITQNVDRLHHQAGSRNTIELHGALAEVRCLACGAITDRAELQTRLCEANPTFIPTTPTNPEGDAIPTQNPNATPTQNPNAIATQNPDGDATPTQTPNATPTQNPDGDATPTTDPATFIIPDCTTCGGLLKPRVVFFGETVPKPRVEAAFTAIAQADALLIAGTSLTIWSGLRFLRAAADRAIPIALINLGPVREGHRATFWLPAPTGRALPALADALLAAE